MELAEECWFRFGTYDCLNDFTVLKNLHSWDGGYSVETSHLWVLVNVEFDNGDAFWVLLGNLVEDGGHCATGAAPGSPEVYKDCLIGCDNFFEV